MRSSIPGRVLAVLALLTILGFPSIVSARPRQASARQAKRAIQAAGFLVRLSITWTHLWGDEGSILDPNGRTRTGTTGGRGAYPAGDEGSGLDPNGK